MSKAYFEFTELFGSLSPYELDHLTEILLCKIEEYFEGKLLGNNKKELNERDLKCAFTATMRDALLEVHANKIARQKIIFNQKKKRSVFSSAHSSLKIHCFDFKGIVPYRIP